MHARAQLGELEKLLLEFRVNLSGTVSLTKRQVATLLKNAMSNLEDVQSPVKLLSNLIAVVSVQVPVTQDDADRAMEASARLWRRRMESQRAFCDLPVSVLIFGTQLTQELLCMPEKQEQAKRVLDGRMNLFRR